MKNRQKPYTRPQYLVEVHKYNGNSGYYDRLIHVRGKKSKLKSDNWEVKVKRSDWALQALQKKANLLPGTCVLLHSCNLDRSIFS
jgi:hypothetical protein